MLSFNSRFVNIGALCIFLVALIYSLNSGSQGSHPPSPSRLKEAANLLSLKQDRTFSENLLVFFFADDEIPYNLKIQAQKLNSPSPNSTTTAKITAVQQAQPGDLVILKSKNNGAQQQVSVKAGDATDPLATSVVNLNKGDKLTLGTTKYQVVEILRSTQ